MRRLLIVSCLFSLSCHLSGCIGNIDDGTEKNPAFQKNPSPADVLLKKGISDEEQEALKRRQKRPPWYPAYKKRN